MNSETEKWLIDANEAYEAVTDLSGQADTKSAYAAFWKAGKVIQNLHAVDAVEVSRLGELGRLMTPYSGCPRGRMGPRVDGGITELDPIEDIEGDRWVPVLEDDLNRLKANVVEVVHSRWTLNDDGSGTCRHCRRTSLYVWDMDNWLNYCPNCGAKMDEE